MKLFENIDLSSFEVKDTLNPTIFDIENNKMKIEVRKKFLRMAKSFYEEIPSSKEPIDVLLTGSMANYNWSDFSDVDIHLVIDFKEFKGDDEMVNDYFFKISNNFKSEHNITFLQYPVEFYIQNSDEQYVKDEGVYSILYDRWLQEPVKMKPNFNKDKIEKYVKNFLGDIRNNLVDYKSEKISKKEFLDNISGFSKKLRKFRQSGLSSEGEFSDKNIAFKLLRRSGVLDKVKNFKAKIFDKNISVPNNDKVSKKEDNKDNDGYTDDISYSVHGVIYSSLRDAAKKTNEKKSTIAYRVHSDNPKYSDYKMLHK